MKLSMFLKSTEPDLDAAATVQEERQRGQKAGKGREGEAARPPPALCLIRRTAMSLKRGVDKLSFGTPQCQHAADSFKNTAPEMLLRSLVQALGYRFRRKDLPGKPDLVFSGRCNVIFLHGGVWHQHSECREGRLPGTRLEYRNQNWRKLLKFLGSRPISLKNTASIS